MPQAASDGTDFLVTWIDVHAGSGHEAVRAARVGRYGTLLGDPFGVRVSPPGTPPFLPQFAGPPVVAWSGNGYVVLWGTGTQANESVRATRVDRDGHVLDTLASNGSGFLVAALRAEGGQNFVAITPVSRGDLPGAPRLVPAGTMPPAVASDGSDYLVTYVDRDGTRVAEHVDDQGALIARNALPPLPANANALAAYGSGYLIAGIAAGVGGGVVAFRVDADGKFLGMLPLAPDAVWTDSVVLAWSGSETLAAWAEAPFGALGAREVMAAIAGDAGESVLVSRAAAPQRGVKLATDGEQLFAVWLEQRPGPPVPHSPLPVPEVRAGRFTRGLVPLDGPGLVLGQAPGSEQLAVTFDGLRYARVAPDGRVLDPTPRKIEGVAAGGSIALASNGRQSLLVFTPDDYGLRAAVIAQDGSLRGFPDRVSWERDPNGTPAAAWSGSTWLVAWTSLQRVPNARQLELPLQADIHAARLSASAELLDPVPIVIAGTLADDILPAAASNGDGFLVAWHGGTDVQARRVADDRTLGDVVTFSRGTAPSVTVNGGDYVVAWIDVPNVVFAPLRAPSLRLSLATGADLRSRVTLLGNVAAYDRVVMEADEVARGFVRAYGILRPRPTAR